MKKLLLPFCLTLIIFIGSVGVSESAEPINGFCLSGTKYSHTPIADKCSSAYEKGDYATALREWKTPAKQGLANAQFNLGHVYRRGHGVPQDDKTAVKWYRLAAKQGNVHAQFSLGWRYHKGQGVTQDYKTAVKWFRLADQQGHASAQSNLGVMYANGKGVPQDYIPAYMWWSIAASSGIKSVAPNAVSARDSVSKRMDPAEIAEAKKLAREFCKKYKGCDSEKAQPKSSLSSKGIQGPDFQTGMWAYMSKDYVTAMRELRPLAEEGNATAQYYVGAMYAFGKGVQKDYVRAYMWASISTTTGENYKGRKLISFLEKQPEMTPAQITGAQKLARECPGKKYKGC